MTVIIYTIITPIVVIISQARLTVGDIVIRGDFQKKKNGNFWEFFPKGVGGVTPIPKTFVKLPSHFWHAKFILRC